MRPGYTVTVRDIIGCVNAMLGDDYNIPSKQRQALVVRAVRCTLAALKLQLNDDNERGVVEMIIRSRTGGTW